MKNLTAVDGRNTAPGLSVNDKACFAQAHRSPRTPLPVLNQGTNHLLKAGTASTMPSSRKVRLVREKVARADNVVRLDALAGDFYHRSAAALLMHGDAAVELVSCPLAPPIPV